MLRRTVRGLLTSVCFLGAADVARADVIGPGFGVSGYSVTATASPARLEDSNTNTNPGGIAQATLSTGGVVGSSAVASAMEGSNFYSGQVYTSISGGFGATSADGSTLIDFNLTGVPTNSITQISLTFDESGQIGAVPIGGDNSVATFSISSDFQLVGEQSVRATANATGLYQNAQLSSTGSLTGIIDPLDQNKFDLSGASTLTTQVVGDNSFVLSMSNSFAVEVFAAIGLGTYNVDLASVSMMNSAGVTPSLTPLPLTSAPVPLPTSFLLLLSGLGALLVPFRSRMLKPLGAAVLASMPSRSPKAARPSNKTTFRPMPLPNRKSRSL